MFELISQIPFHFATSLCLLMDPIYYIYHKLYHIVADHVGHYHQMGARGAEQQRCWREGNRRSHAGPCLSSFPTQLFLPFIANQKSRSGGRDHSSDGLIDLKAGRDELVVSLLRMLDCLQRLNRHACEGYLQVTGRGRERESRVQDVCTTFGRNERNDGGRVSLVSHTNTCVC